MSDGHTCLKTNESARKSVGDFQLVLSYNNINQNEAEFVIHVWSTTYDHSPYIQRLQLLERMGFSIFENCTMTGSRCYYQVLGKVRRHNIMGGEQETENYHRKFNQFADKIQEIFDLMRSLDRLLYDAGLKLPYLNMSLKQTNITEQEDETIIHPGEQYNVFKKVNSLIKQAKNEVFIIDAYPDDSLFELYLDDIPKGVNINFLTNKPNGKFLSVASLWRKNPDKNIEIRKSKQIHDRHLFIDDECWVIGASIKDAGNKPTYIMKLNEKDILYSTYKNIFDNSSII